jgi:hypothetical protein
MLPKHLAQFVWSRWISYRLNRVANHNMPSMVQKTMLLKTL